MADRVNQRQSDMAQIRTADLAPELVKLLEAVGQELDVYFEVFSGGQDETTGRTGSHRHDHGKSADLFVYRMENGQKRYLDQSDPEDLKVWKDVLKLSVAGGAKGIGAGPGYMRPNSAHIGFGSSAAWGKDGKGANAPGWVKESHEAGLKTPPLSIPNGPTTRVADAPTPMPGRPASLQTARALGNAGSVGAGVALGSPLNDRLPNDAGYGVQLASATPLPEMTPGQSNVAPSSRGSPFVDTGAAMEQLRAPARDTTPRALGSAPTGGTALGSNPAPVRDPRGLETRRPALLANISDSPASPEYVAWNQQNIQDDREDRIVAATGGALGSTPTGPLAGALGAVGGAAPTAAARLVDIHDRRDAVPAAAPPTPIVAAPVAPTPLPALARPTTVAAAPTPMPAPARPAASAPSQTAPQATVTNASAPAQELVRLPSGKMVAPGTYENESSGISYTVSAGPNGTGIVTPNRAGAVNIGREMNAPTLLGGMIRARVPEAVEAGLGAARDSFAPAVEGVRNAATNAIDTLAPSVQGIGSTLSNAFGGAFSFGGNNDRRPTGQGMTGIHDRREDAAIRAQTPAPAVAPSPLPSPSFFRGAGGRRDYEVGRIYSNANGSFVAQADGTFRRVTSGGTTAPAAVPVRTVASAPESRSERFTNLDSFGNII